jgi:hypothetical protein
MECFNIATFFLLQVSVLFHGLQFLAQYIVMLTYIWRMVWDGKCWFILEWTNRTERDVDPIACLDKQ